MKIKEKALLKRLRFFCIKNFVLVQQAAYFYKKDKQKASPFSGCHIL